MHKLSNYAIRHIDDSDRDDLKHDHLHFIVSHIIGMFLISAKYHSSVITLILTGNVHNSMNLIRSQLESLLIYLYFIEPQNNISEIKKRITKYTDWICVKMYQNYNKSSKFSFLQVVYENGEECEITTEQYNKIKNSYNEDEFKILKK